eukprot:SAG11_NODE_25253_length_361_cov_0.992366_1_plen_47_part_10
MQNSARSCGLRTNNTPQTTALPRKASLCEMRCQTVAQGISKLLCNLQ